MDPRKKPARQTNIIDDLDAVARAQQGRRKARSSKKKKAGAAGSTSTSAASSSKTSSTNKAPKAQGVSTSSSKTDNIARPLDPRPRRSLRQVQAVIHDSTRRTISESHSTRKAARSVSMLICRLVYATGIRTIFSTLSKSTLVQPSERHSQMPTLRRPVSQDGSRHKKPALLVLTQRAP